MAGRKHKKAPITRLYGRSGFTLVEVMVTVGIFGLAFGTIGAIFLGYSVSQARATQAQRLLNEGNYVFDSIAREVRMNAVDYACNVDYTTDTSYLCLRSLEGKAIHLRVVDEGGKKKVKVCKEQTYPATPCDPADPTKWSDLVPDFMTVLSMKLYVYPASNPYQASDAAEIFHPMTIITMSLESGRGRARQVYDFQTAVSSRVYNF